MINSFDISVIICTYKPQREYFEPCLHAVAALDVSELNVEVVLVDNNSPEPIENQTYISDFIQRNNVKLIKETKQGLSYARIAGVANTTAPIVVFFDDDNAPASDYLQKVKKYFDTYSFLGILGPGNVEVLYLNQLITKRLEELRYMFQEKHTNAFEYACIPDSVRCYPPGTGFVVRREVLMIYANDVIQYNYQTTGRSGNNLIGAEDIQIILTSVKMNLAIGVAPELKIKHLTPEKRTQISYLKKLRYGNIKSYFPAIIEVFPEKREDINAMQSGLSGIRLLLSFIILIMNVIKTGNVTNFHLNLSYKLGWYAGIYCASKSQLPWLAKILIKMNKLE